MPALPIVKLYGPKTWLEDPGSLAKQDTVPGEVLQGSGFGLV